MPAVQVLGDVNNGGGAITTIPQSTVFVNNKLVVVNGSSGTGHVPCSVFSPQHCAGAWFTTSGAATVLIGGIPVNHDGNPDTCGHTRISGSADVFVN